MNSRFATLTASLFLVFALVHCQTPTALPWPDYWNATITVTMNDIVIGAPAVVYYDYPQGYQRVDFSQCAVAGGTVNNEPCTMVFSSVKDNFGIWTIFPDGSCCVNFANIGNLTPSWTTVLDYNATLLVNGKEAIRFNGGAPDFHTYYVTNDQYQSPLFAGPEEWTFTSALSVGPQNPNLFSELTPISQCSPSCPSS